MSDKWKGEGTSYMTKGLFLEECDHTIKHRALYTTKTWDKEYKGKHCPSLHKLYVEMEDLAEWHFANKYLGGYTHWLQLKACNWFKEYYAAMVGELNAKISGRSIAVMLEQMTDKTASQATLKYLADNDYIKKAAVGKPKRSKPKAEVLSIVDADMARIKGK